MLKFREALLASIRTPKECDYCGVGPADGDFPLNEVQRDGRWFELCEFCIDDPTLGACRHGGICDCSAGVCS